MVVKGKNGEETAQYKSKQNDMSQIADFLEDFEPRSASSSWKKLARGMHSLTDHYEDITHEKAGDVYNKLRSERSSVSQLMAEEALFKYAKDEISLEQAIAEAREEYC